ncbi:hypothetical protein MMPV_001640 [Pyropia vietnamensis]
MGGCSTLTGGSARGDDRDSGGGSVGEGGGSGGEGVTEGGGAPSAGVGGEEARTVALAVTEAAAAGEAPAAGEAATAGETAAAVVLSPPRSDRPFDGPALPRGASLWRTPPRGGTAASGADADLPGGVGAGPGGATAGGSRCLRAAGGSGGGGVGGVVLPARPRRPLPLQHVVLGVEAPDAARRAAQRVASLSRLDGESGGGEGSTPSGGGDGGGDGTSGGERGGGGGPTSTCPSVGGSERPLAGLMKRVKRVATVTAFSTVTTTQEHTLIKLEAISAREMWLLNLIQGIAVVFALVYTPTVTLLARGPWRAAGCTAARCEAPHFAAVEWFNFVFSSVVLTLMAAYSLWFAYVLFYRARQRRPEVLWACILLPVVLAANNPAFYLDRVTVLGGGPSRVGASVLAGVRYVSNAYAVSAFTLYVLLKFGSFARSAGLEDPYPPRFYALRLAGVGAVFFAMLAVCGSLRLEMSPQPVVSLAALSRRGAATTATISAAVGVGALQLLLFVFFLLQYRRASRRIAQRGYVETRLKHLNLHFFFSHTLLPLGTTLILTSVCAVLFPLDLVIGEAAAAAGAEAGVPPAPGPFSWAETLSLDVPYYARAGIVLVYCVYALIETRVSLPSTYKPTWLEKQLLERLSSGNSVPGGGAGGGELGLGAAAAASLAGAAATTPTAGFGDEEAVPAAELPFLWENERDSDGREVPQMHKLVIEEVVLLFNMSWLVYLTDPVIDAALRDEGAAGFRLRHVWREAQRDLVVLVLERADVVVVAFRGTVSVANWYTNVRISQEPHVPLEDPPWLRPLWRSPAWGAKRPRVHSGFWMAYESVRSELLDDVRRCLTEVPNRRVMVTGHSLGGALATLCAFDCRVQLGMSELDVTVITFGSPRVGNRAFTRRFLAAVPVCFRIMNHSDGVTNVPSSFFSNFEHVPRGVLVDGYGNLIIDPMFVDLKLFHGTAFTPHLMEGYRDSLNAFIDTAIDSRYEPKWIDFDRYAGSEESATAAMRHDAEALRDITSFLPFDNDRTIGANIGSVLGRINALATDAVRQPLEVMSESVREQRRSFASRRSSVLSPADGATGDWEGIGGGGYGTGGRPDGAGGGGGSESDRSSRHWGGGEGSFGRGRRTSRLPRIGGGGGGRDGEGGKGGGGAPPPRRWCAASEATEELPPSHPTVLASSTALSSGDSLLPNGSGDGSAEQRPPSPPVDALVSEASTPDAGGGFFDAAPPVVGA